MKKQSDYKWDLSALQKGDNDPFSKEKRKKIEKKIFQFVNTWEKNNEYLASPQVLKKALDQYEDIKHFWWPDGDEAFYFHLRSEQEQTNPKIKAKLQNINDFSIALFNKIQFFPLNIAKIKKEDRDKFLKAENLSIYKHFLEKLFLESDHLLSDDEEKILNLKQAVSYENWVKMTAGFLSKEEALLERSDGKKEKHNYSELISLMKDQDKVLRDSAAEAFNEIMVKHSDTAEIELNSVLCNKKIDDELRSFELPESSRLLSDDIEKEIVDKMILAVAENFDISAKLYRLKSKLFKVKKLAYHERNLDFGKINKKYDFESAVDIVAKSLGNLDVDFKEIYNDFFINKRIDAFPRKDKYSGAFCSGNLLSQPTYILLNYNNRLTDVTTLAHEIGHGINNELMKKSQNALNFGNSLAIAEVASTFFEDYALEEILKDADEETKLGVILNRLDSDISSIFRQIACFLFERKLHQEFRKKNYLSKEEIGRLFAEHMKKYMGNFIEQSKGSENWWIYWSHIRAFFYNYSYANGLLISKSLQEMVKKNPSDIKKVKSIFSAGLSKSPRQIFLDEGIDISHKSFWQKGIDGIADDLRTAESLAKKLGKI